MDTDVAKEIDDAFRASAGRRARVRIIGDLMTNLHTDQIDGIEVGVVVDEQRDMPPVQEYVPE